jgi:hypothetical protein
MAGSVKRLLAAGAGCSGTTRGHGEMAAWSSDRADAEGAAGMARTTGFVLTDAEAGTAPPAGECGRA